MKFTKFGKALLISALSAGVLLGVTSCVQSYTVGFLYVTGTVTGQSGSNGIISGFKIDHNTGKLTAINGLPISSGGANPGRFVLLTGSRFIYVLNRGLNASGGTTCTASNPCLNSNITEFAVGGNGILTPQETFYTQGLNPFRIMADTSGNYLLVLDHDSPSNATCSAALGSSATSCGDITVFQVNQTTGRLTLVVNAQVSAAGTPITYFPVPANPIDFLMSSSYVLTLSGTPAAGDSVYPYTYSNGQLTLSVNSPQTLNIKQATAIVSASGVVYVLDNEAPSPNPNGAQSQFLPFTVGNNGALQAEPGGNVAEDPTLANPIYIIAEASKSQALYVVNQGNNTTGTNAASGIGGYVVTNSPSYKLTPTTPAYFGSGANPQCIVEDPSNQFIYTANFNDSTVTGRVVDPNSGVLNNMRVASSYAVNGPPAWCLVDGRTN